MMNRVQQLYKVQCRVMPIKQQIIILNNFNPDNYTYFDVNKNKLISCLADILFNGYMLVPDFQKTFSRKQVFDFIYFINKFIDSLNSDNNRYVIRESLYIHNYFIDGKEYEYFTFKDFTGGRGYNEFPWSK
ncbi:hypothetical protein JK628_23135 (plasmid) [Shewanella sp. KX20019]|uniref:hypothetical protein n=1 Tax=Shewanella sp. KX20019 TaxID=2803864 RepID=UPI0019263DC1|nr:hypothetical protein [Shewanella sp. KX20019]QQX82678.1 hypothetical protein JK628_23135 [Shewanella sp. KX20019]